MAEENNLKLIQEKIEKLFKLLEVDAKIDVSEGDEAFTVAIDAGDNNALLIGKHGNTLSSLEYILYILAGKDLPEGKRLYIS